MRFFWRRRGRGHEIAPDEIFLDSSNLPEYNSGQFEGRVERAIGRTAVIAVGIVFVCTSVAFGSRAFYLQIAHGETYADISRNNTLQRQVLFATRGLVHDRNGLELAWNEMLVGTSSEAVHEYALRRYSALPGLSHLIGFLQYPRADSSGEWWREEYAGVSGIELAFNDVLQGANGSILLERNARGEMVRENIVSPPEPGGSIRLSIDAEVQSTLHTMLAAHAERMRFRGGAAVIMDVRTGEILAITSFPEYDNEAYMHGDTSVVQSVSSDARSPLLNRAIAGLYAPGSIVKPMFAAAALNEGIISPEKQIQSTGALVLPNPYDPSNPSIFRDWAVHGWVDMRNAIAVSSDEYFYTIGGGYGSQRGLGIAKIDEYALRFGFAQPTGIALAGEAAGVIPTPEWKLSVFGEDDPWRIGNTYHTSIGQFGFQITPLQAVRHLAAIVNGGKLLTPQLVANAHPAFVELGIPDEHLQVAREGMRLAVTSTRGRATMRAVDIPGIVIAGKSGTAEVGARNEFMHSWSIGYWPAHEPKYAYAVVLERAPAGTLSGASPALVPFFNWLIANKPEYVQ